MLAWVFWHTRRPDADAKEYGTTLEELHSSLGRLKLEGHLGTRALQYSAVPWLSSSTEVHEDWYYLKSSAALDALDASIADEPLRSVHLRIVRQAESGIGGLYRLRSGTPMDAPVRCSWLAKPRHLSYDDFIATAGRSGTVWSRQMVLGPTPEFCVESNTPVASEASPFVILELLPVR